MGFFFSSFNSFVVFIDLANVNFRKIIVCKTRDGMEFLCLDLSVLCANYFFFVGLELIFCDDFAQFS